MKHFYFLIILLITATSFGQTITVGASVSGLDYTEGTGPSMEGTFTIEGTGLTADIFVFAPTDFEVSLSSGSGFAVAVSVPQSAGTVATTTIYARLKVGLSAMAYAGDVNVSSSGATSQTVGLSGTVSTVTCSGAGDIIITEIMHSPSAVSDSNGEYFEVYNTTGSPIDLNGWTISDVGADSHTISSSLVVPANGYAVLGIDGNSGTNGGVTVDYEYSNFMLDWEDEIILDCSGSPIDIVIYNAGLNFPNTMGASMELESTKMNATDNNTGSNWGDATSTYGAGDLGSPGSANDFVLSIGRNEIEGFAVYPNPVSNGSFRISSANRVSKAIQVYDITGKQVLSKQVQSNEAISVDNLNSGIYILKVVEEGRTATRKLIIE